MIKPLLAILGALLLGIMIVGGVLAKNTASGSFDRTVSIGEPAQVIVQAGSGSIRVHSGTTGSVIIHGEVRASSPDAENQLRQIQQNPPIELSGNTIRIGRTDNSGLFHNVSISYDITVPASSQVEARSGSGSVKISTVRGPVIARTGSGAVEVADAGVDVTAETGSGSIRLANVSGKVTAHTGSGSIKANGDPTANWKMETGSGSIAVDFPPSAGFDVRAHTGSGSIRIEQSVTTQGSFGKNRLEGEVHGGGPLVEIGTGSGSVHIGTGGGQAL